MIHATGAGTLAGVRVALLRAPERGGAMAAELARRGAETMMVPLIDWELPEDPTRLDDCLRAASTYDWVLLTSVTTVRVIEQRAHVLGTDLRALLQGVRVAAVGTATREVLEHAGVVVALMPEGDQSAAGLLAELPAGGFRALLPQSEIAADTLRAGLQARGWTVDVVTAYLTVDYPAAAGRRLRTPDTMDGAAAGEPALTRQDLVLALGDGRLDALVLTSPSIAERLHAIIGQLPEDVAVIAIGRRTEHDAVALGLRIHAVAATPGPSGIADAVAAAVVKQRKKR